MQRYIVQVKTALIIVVLVMALSTTAFSASYTQEWLYIFDGGGDRGDFGYDIALDSSNNVFVSGKISSGANGSDYEAYCCSLSSDGAFRWDSPLYSTAHDTANDVAVGNDGSVYFTGDFYYSDPNDDDTFLRKMSNDGSEIWTEYYDGSESTADICTAIDFNDNGDIYVSGSCRYINQHQDMYVAKYNTAGTLLWQKHYDGPANNRDYAYDIAVDPQGNAYIAGYISYYRNGDFDRDFCVVKYDKFGTYQWMRNVNGSADTADQAYSITLDADNYIIAAGYLSNVNSDADIYIVKYAPDGTKRWDNTYAGSYGDDVASKVTTDINNNIFVVGYCTSNDSDLDTFTRKIDPNGNELWTNAHNGSDDDWDRADSITCGADGSAYVVGLTSNANNGPDGCIIKYGSGGDLIWIAEYDGPVSSGYDAFYDIVLDNNENIYVSGSSEQGGTARDLMIAKYSQDTPIEDDGYPVSPKSFALFQSQPNPSSGSVTIKFALLHSAEIELAVFDIKGRKLMTAAEGKYDAGEHSAEINGLSSGIYLYRLQTDGTASTKKMIVK